MSISPHPSTVTLPHKSKPYPSIIEFLVKRFPNIEKKIWEKRIEDGKVLNESGEKINFQTEYIPYSKLIYFREVADEFKIPFKEKIIFRNSDYIIADKPHFLPVIPAGQYVNECLLNRLKLRTGNRYLTPVNRIDRETAGLVMFSCKKETRGLYSNLFSDRKVLKTYEAVTRCSARPEYIERVISNRVVKGTPWFRMKIEDGEPNTVTNITLLDYYNDKTHFRLTPVTGKKHQLRLHLSSMGYGIINDRYYPVLLEKKDPDYNKPLQLLAKSIEFVDPISGLPEKFTSRQILSEIRK